MKLNLAKTSQWIVVRSMPEDPGALAELRSLGLVPGTPTRVIRRAPLWGPLLLEVEGRTAALCWRTARQVEVQPASDPDPPTPPASALSA